ncbi:TetR/AcrR family transcriptional regulator [Rothia sp. (in: high G+C Gram-positive bacteria)]|uniref:TetR/AcrR family transcriptional regulator n=1 Tax=Rothia sp. (in: high G+C Gram-positive bacteria) TaxID=1885016 RepID=UPI0032169946
MSAREKILDAYERVLVENGERAATLEAIAKAAGVSKGGLLYHFKDKRALASGLLQRLDTLAEQDAVLMSQDPAGATDYYVRTSVWQDSPLDRTIISVTRLGNDFQPAVNTAMKRVQDRWLSLLEDEVKDPHVARAILLIGDGLYYNAVLSQAGDSSEKATSAQGQSPSPSPADIKGLLGAISKLVGNAA